MKRVTNPKISIFFLKIKICINEPMLKSGMAAFYRFVILIDKLLGIGQQVMK